MWLALVLTPLQILIGDLHGINTLEYQPMKLAAIEARWETGAARADDALRLARCGAGAQRTTRSRSRASAASSSPILERRGQGAEGSAARRSALCAAALLRLSHHGRHRRRAAGDRWAALVLRWRGRLYDTRWFAMLCAFSSPLPFIAILAGWTVTETGAAALDRPGPSAHRRCGGAGRGGAVSASLTLFVAVYLVLLVAHLLVRVAAGVPRAGRDAPNGPRRRGRVSTRHRRI